ncbi:MAG: alpha/beta fold hydrolase [Gammaproteobacteria bacterium]
MNKQPDPDTQAVVTCKDGHIIHADVRGTGEPLILLHGWTLDRRMWLYQLPALSQHFKVVSFDRRGFGATASKPSMDRELSDLDDILEQLEIDSAAVLGMSQGGRITVRYALTRPEKLNTMILHAPALDGFSPPAEQPDHIPMEYYSELVRAGDIEQFRQEWLKHPLMQIPTGHAAVKQKIMEILNDYPARDLAGDMEEQTGIGIDAVHRLDQINMPTLIIIGAEETPWFALTAEKFSNEIPGAKKAVIPGGGHMINMLEPEAYNNTIIQFLQQR